MQQLVVGVELGLHVLGLSEALLCLGPFARLV